MAFTTGHLNDPQAVGAGEIVGTAHVILTATTFEDELQVGRFAKLDTGSLDNIDASATPTLAGVVLRNAASAVEDGDTIDSALYSEVQYMRQGLVTVDVVTGVTPVKFGPVYVENQTPADYGKATDVSLGNVAANAEFIHEVQTDVWVVRLY